MRIVFIYTRTFNIASSVKLRNVSSAYTGQHSSTGNDIVATIANFDPSIPSTVENLLAYRPNYTDVHMSGLAGMFINGIEGLFPCVAGPPEYQPVYKMFTFEGDGFRNGHTAIDAADMGNNFDVFNGTKIATYGLILHSLAVPLSPLNAFHLVHGIVLSVCSQEIDVVRLV